MLQWWELQYLSYQKTKNTGVKKMRKTKCVIRGKDVFIVDETGAILERNVLKEGEEVDSMMLESIIMDMIEHCSIHSLRNGDLSGITIKLLGVFEIRKRKG